MVATNVHDTGRLLPFRCPDVQCCMFLASFRKFGYICHMC